MGEVYLARDVRLNRDVALKILRDKDQFDAHRLARFQREAQVLASLNHPNIATLLGIEAVGDVQALVLEFVAGETLAVRLTAGRLPLGETLSIAGQMVDALDAAHERGVVHRDLKPANVMIRPDGMVKVLDFGLAKTLDECDSAGVELTTLTATAHAIIGTAGYMSPEQARGSAVDRRTDVWAFGCVLYEMLAGRRAFDGATNSDAMAAVLMQEPDWSRLPADLPEPLRRLLRRCLDKDVRQRLRDIADARDDLRGLQHSSSSQVLAPASQARGFSRRAAIAIGTLGLLALLASIVPARFAWPSGKPRPEQFVLLPPEGTSFGGGPIDRTPALAISPDGERLAFVATNRSEGSHPVLWVRSVGSLDAVPLAGTEDAREPFWSPDGSFIGFFAGGKLKKIPSAGGTPTSLADAPLGSGGTWNRDNVIVFAPDTQGGLLRIPHTGGTPTPVTRLSKDDYGHVYPQFLPDGRRFLFLNRAMQARKGIYVASIDSPDVTFVMPAREKAKYAAPGHMMFLKDGRLMAQTFNPDTLRLASDPVAVAESVAFIATDGRASYDVTDTGVLVYRANGLLAASQPVWLDASGTRVGTVGEPGDYQSAGLSPDGSMMVVEKHDLRTSSGDLWLIDLKTGSTSRLTFDGMHNTLGVWSPDGKRIVFTGRPNGIRNLHLKSIGTEFDEPLLPPGPDRLPTDWSSDGARILYEQGFAAPRDVFVLEMPERRPVAFLDSPFDERGAKFSPDGRWVAYVSNETGRGEVYVRSYPQAGNKRQLSVTGGRAPRWSRDGRTLFYADPNGAVMAIDVLTTASTIQAGLPKVLFATDMRRAESGSGITADAWFAVSGQRFFVVPNPLGPVPPALPITVIANWTARQQ